MITQKIGKRIVDKYIDGTHPFKLTDNMKKDFQRLFYNSLILSFGYLLIGDRRSCKSEFLIALACYGEQKRFKRVKSNVRRKRR
ncbi:hypothetical protein DN443_05470 [Lactobacillus reuteri]|nr:hypothetical protein [Limosilactobacillus reuteri]MQC04758.1 hypothetical protein [Limosilactobacillus reuteri]